MKRIVKKSKSFNAAERWDIKQIKRLSLKERLLIADELKRRVYGEDPADVRDVPQCIRKTR